MPIFCVLLVRYAKRISWRFARARGVQVDLFRRRWFHSVVASSIKPCRPVGEQAWYRCCLCSACVSCPFFLAEVAVVAPPLNLSQRALAAAESFARVEGEK